jgi:hypothetical protein
MISISTTVHAVVIIATKGAGDKFVISAIRPIFGSAPETIWRSCCKPRHHFRRGRKHAGFVVALLKCSSGRFGSCLEAIKAEAITELAASQQGVHLVKVAPQSLKKTLGCASDQKWRDRAADLFNSDGQHRDWSKGLAGAASVAYKVAGANVL